MRINSLSIYDEDRCVLFALGRNAMYAACRILGIKSGDEILTPAFDCDGSLQPFNVLGLKLLFYRSDPYTFSADVDDIKRRITSKTRLIHVINHFGMPQPWEELLSLKRETQIPILEDNAYSLFSEFKGRQFGEFGDMAIYSLRKNLPLIDGGMLRINNPQYVFTLHSKSAPLFYPTEINGILTLMKSALGYYRAPETIRRFIKKFNPAIEPPPPLYSEAGKGYPDWPARDKIGKEFSCDYLRPISKLARFQLSRFSDEALRHIAEKKRAHYTWLSERLSAEKGLTILWPELSEGIVPFCLSLLVESNRDFIFGELRKKYDVMAWPTLPQAVLDRLKDYPDVELLGRRLLQLNLPSDKVRSSGFPDYLKDLVRDMVLLLRG